MNATTVAVDPAKSVFQLAVADDHWRVVETQRLTRTQFERWFLNPEVSLVIMEACGSAHHWGRWFNALGIEVRLLPAQYIRSYVIKRNKTDAADAAALLEARVAQLERELATLARLGPACTTLLSIPAIGLLTATAKVADNAGREACGVRRWALDVQVRSNHNKTACALANKLARICYATLRDKQPFVEPTVRLGKKFNRESFVMPA